MNEFEQIEIISQIVDKMFLSFEDIPFHVKNISEIYLYSRSSIVA